MLGKAHSLANGPPERLGAERLRHPIGIPSGYHTTFQLLCRTRSTRLLRRGMPQTAVGLRQADGVLEVRASTE